MNAKKLRSALSLLLLAGGLLSLTPAKAGTYSMTSNWDLENTHRMLKESLPKEALDVSIKCQTLNLAVGNDLSRCGADWRMP